MPQSTNLNKTPYYDDFNPKKNFYKVLFKPGVTVQTRELTTLQSILQNQIEKFGSKFFNNGGVVIPGNTAYIPVYNAVEVETNFKGINVEEYFSSFIGRILVGFESGVSAKVINVISSLDSERNTTTIFVKYLSPANDFVTEQFTPGEELIADFDVPLGAGFILQGESVLQVLNPTGRSPLSVGTAARIEEGVYFVRGYFVDVESQEIILDQYSNTPSYRVGLSILETIIDSDDDSSLNDNAQGFSNFAAPGADRFTIQLTLSKKPLDDLNDDSFIELFRVENGIIRKIKQETTGSFITDVLAKRTFDESGNYTLDPYNVKSVESLNNNLGNGGVYLSGQRTTQGGVPSEDLGLIQVSPGTSYVKGYEVVTQESVVDFPKPRTTKKIESSSVSFYGGDLIRVNNVKSSPKVGLSTIAVVTLHAERLENQVATGSTIGFARVYDFEHHNTSYESPASQFNLKLFDIQTYTSVSLASSIPGIPIGAYIQGSNSGASGYAKSITNDDTTFELYQVTGKFIKNESLVINGISSTSSSISTVTDYSIEDIKSVSDSSGFVCDTVLSNSSTLVGPFNVVVYAPTGIATVTRVNGTAFSSAVKVNDVLSYQPSGFTSTVYARVSEFSSNRSSATIVGVSTVQNICTGNVGVGTYTLQTIDVVRPTIVRPENSTLYNRLTHQNISNIDLINSNITVKVQYTGVTKSGTTLTLPSLSGTNYVYSAFDEERYLVINANGSLENLTNATFTLTSGGKEAQFTNLSAASGPCVVITTQIKSNVSSKKKRYSRSNSLILNRTKYSTPKNAGLTYSPVYGTRVDDNQISLNTPDLVEVVAVYEASETSDPQVPWISIADLTSPTSNTSDLILGEYLIGSESGAVAVYVEQKNSTQIYLVYKTDKTFQVSEEVIFQESGYSAVVGTVNPGDRNIINNFTIDNGQRRNYYDYGRLVKKPTAQEPVGRLKIYFDTFTFDSSDSGDLITANSYLTALYGTKIPSIDGIRNTDVIDIRPRVSSYNTSSQISPFDFSSRLFDTSGANSAQILASDESVVFDYEFYLGRTDKLTLDRDGNFNLTIGEPSETPISPSVSEEVLEVATIYAAPYIYNIEDPKEVKIVLTDNKRFTMSDLRKIEDRVEYLEYYTTLSLLETNTENLLIEDSNGLNRFKCGFFVDNFSDGNSADVENPIFSADFENAELISVSSDKRIDLSVYSSDSAISKSEINLDDTSSTNVTKTGDTITLDYTQVEYFKQPFASRVVSVNPFDIVTWVGALQLNPKIDTWTEQRPAIEVGRVIGRGDFGPIFNGNVVSDVPYIRPRNIEFVATRLKPNTRFKFLFESKVVSGSDAVPPGSFVFPKLLEIDSVVGSFSPGETVGAYDENGSLTAKFRICVPNHKSGPHRSPTRVFSINPYNPTVGISSLYGTQSTVLNVDTESLQTANISEFWGNLNTGSRLYGFTSKATARVSDNKLVSDENGTVVGSIFTGKNQFRTGTTTAKITTQQAPLGVPGESTSEAQNIFTSKGTIVQPTYVVWYDPLAQTFLVEEESGIVPTSIDIFFAKKDSNIPVELQIRETVNGYPGTPDKVIPGLTKVLLPSEVNVSSNATVPTTFTFDKLVRLPAGEYALVLVSDSPDYLVWHSRMGEVEITTSANEEIGKVIINKQPSMGVMFKAQNGSTWTPSQEDDIKFTLRRADFTATSGTLRLFNSPQVVVNPEHLLGENPIYSISTSASALNDGRHILVQHPNHGMHSPNEKVEISGVIPDTIPTTLTVSYGATATSSISIASTSIFSTYDGSIVSAANPGYIKISDEIIKYETVLSGQLGNITRAQFGTVSLPHSVNSLVNKYEFNNVPLSKINTTHTILSNPKPTLDSYYIQVSVGSTFTVDKFGGGSNVYAGENTNFSTLTLNEDLIEVPNRASISARVRTISERSIDGSEIAFVDQGYESIDVFNPNNFNTLRTVASKANEVEYLNSTAFEGQKSLTLELTLSTTDSKVSPIVDIDQIYIDLRSSRLNQPVGLSSYASDPRVNSNLEDPHSFVYISKKISLEQSATSIKSIITAYRDSTSDIRMLYKIFRSDVPDEDQVWELFPGYENLDVNGLVIDSDNNDGRSDQNVPSSLEDEFREYSFTVDNLPSFTAFAIKIVATGTNQALPPRIRQLRSIALA
jgi:hypothetical protein